MLDSLVMLDLKAKHLEDKETRIRKSIENWIRVFCKRHNINKEDFEMSLLVFEDQGNLVIDYYGEVESLNKEDLIAMLGIVFTTENVEYTKVNIVER